MQLEACLLDFWWEFAIAAVVYIYDTSVSLAVEPMYSFLLKFILTNSHHTLS